mgnify:CR=1 FL=1
MHKKPFGTRRLLVVGGYTLLFLCSMLFLITMRGEKAGSIQQENYYRDMEKEYVHSVKELLKSKGFRNSGITMTRITESDGCRNYTLSIYDKKINNLSESDRQKLGKEINYLLDSPENCNFYQEFLASD